MTEMERMKKSAKIIQAAYDRGDIITDQFGKAMPTLDIAKAISLGGRSGQQLNLFAEFAAGIAPLLKWHRIQFPQQKGN